MLHTDRTNEASSQWMQEQAREYELAALGLDSEIFVQAAREANHARNSVSSLDARNFPGTTFWSTYLKFLRIGLIPRGWRSDYIDGYDLTIHPEAQFAIAVTRGNDAVGNDERRDLKTHAPKGRATKRVVAQNARQQLLLPQSMLPPVQLIDRPVPGPRMLRGLLLWYVLHYEDELAGVLRHEFSLPTAHDETDRPAQWARRIVLPSVAIDEVTVVVETDDMQGLAFDDETIEVGVRRRDAS